MNNLLYPRNNNTLCKIINNARRITKIKIEGPVNNVAKNLTRKLKIKIKMNKKGKGGRKKAYHGEKVDPSNDKVAGAYTHFSLPLPLSLF